MVHFVYFLLICYYYYCYCCVVTHSWSKIGKKERSPYLCKSETVNRLRPKARHQDHDRDRNCDRKCNRNSVAVTYTDLDLDGVYVLESLQGRILKHHTLTWTFIDFQTITNGISRRSQMAFPDDDMAMASVHNISQMAWHHNIYPYLEYFFKTIWRQRGIVAI